MSIRKILFAVAITPALSVICATTGWAQGPVVTDLTGRKAMDYCALAKALNEPCKPRGISSRGLPPGRARDAATQTGASRPSGTETVGSLTPTAAAALRVEFELGSAELTRQARNALALLAGVIQSSDAKKWLIEGHTDARGSEELNLDLSERRAKAAIDYLVNEHGINPALLEAKGFGKQRLMVTEDPFNGRNRRVQVVKYGS